MAAVALGTPDDRHDALREIVRELLALDEPRRHFAGMLSGLDLRYDLGEDHPLIGRRMPDLDLDTADGPTRVFTLLHDARPVLLHLGPSPTPELGARAARLRVVQATYDGAWVLPVVGEVTPPPAVLVRPDGYVAWAGGVGDPGLSQALDRWC